MAWSWEFMLQVFNALGGEAGNVARKNGPAGEKMVAAVPDKPIHLYAPENLIFPVSEVELVGGRLKIKDASVIGKAERSFFENFYESFSWSDGDREQAAAFLKGLDDLPADVRAFLWEEYGIDLTPVNSSERSERWLLQRRLLGWRGKAVLVPIFELVEHDPKAQPYNEADGIFLTGKFANEIGMPRGRLSPFAAFWRFGFASPEREAFSLPMELNTADGLGVTIAQDINLSSRLGSMPVPEFKHEGNSVRFSCLMVGSARNPRLSRGIFYRVMRDAGGKNPEQVFDNILHINRLSYLKLLELLEPYEGGLIPTLRKVARLQLETMSWCIGTRDL